MSHSELSTTTSTAKRNLFLGLAVMACFAALVLASALSGSSTRMMSSTSERFLAVHADVAPVVLPTATPVAEPAPVVTPSAASAIETAEIAAPVTGATPIRTPAAGEVARIAVATPAPIDVRVVEAPALVDPAPVVEAPAAVEFAPVVEVAPVIPAPWTPAPVVQVAAVAPATTRRGPAAVVNQIPASAFRWLEANSWTVEWRQGPGPGRQAEAQYTTSTIVIWHDNSYSSTIWAGAFAHELGHAVSYVHFNNAQMNEWNHMRGLASWRWVPGTPNDFSVGEGDFAEAFMSYLLGHSPRSVGGQLTQAQVAWIAANTPF